MTKMCEVMRDSWPMLKTGGSGSSQASEHVGISEDVSRTDYQHCMNSAVCWSLLLPKLILTYVFEGTAYGSQWS